MCPIRYFASDVDGRFCIVCQTTDSCNPAIVTMHWPTNSSTDDILRLLYTHDELTGANRLQLIDAIECKQSRIGEYFVGLKQSGYQAPWRVGFHVLLADGGRTLAIKTDVIDAPRPKTRCEVYWSSGAWIKRTSKKNERIDPLTVSL